MEQLTGLIRYDAMCHAIAEAHAIDEVKDLRDKALALEHYARQAMNMDAERKACEIRLRAERRAGELLAEMGRNGGRATKQSPKSSGKHVAQNDMLVPPTLSDLGISRDQSSRWQKLASVPSAQFEEALQDPQEMPSTAGIIRKASGKSGDMDPRALWLWGRLRDFEKDRIASVDPKFLLDEMTATMLVDIKRIAPLMSEYLHLLSETITHDAN